MGEHHRPGFHVRPASGWVNDPNAPVHVGGRYHLFCQHNPGGTVHADVHWAHFSSTDLVHWTTHPIALTPTQGAPDADGCWSGCAVVVDGEPWLLYSGNLEGAEHQTVCLARPEGSADGSHSERWVVDPEPVMRRPPEGDDLAVFRDPFAWRADDGYRMLVGAGRRDGTGVVLVYRSPDLQHWEQLGPFCAATHPAFAGWDTADAWECPHLLRRGDRGLLVVSLWRAPGGPEHVLYASGALVGDRLEPQRVGRLDHGPDFYAPALTVDDTGRCVLWGWAWEARDDADVLADGWAGLLTVPRVLELTADGTASLRPVPELAVLREGDGAQVDRRLPAGGSFVVSAGAGRTLDLSVRLTPPAGGRAWVQVLAAADGIEATEVGVDGDTGEVYVSRDRSSTAPGARRGTSAMRVLPDEENGWALRILVDASIVEVFAADGSALTARVYPHSAASVGLVAGVDGGAGGRDGAGDDAGSGRVEVQWWRMRTEGTSTAPTA